MAALRKLPEGYFACHWCKGGVRFIKDQQDGGDIWPARCPHCSMHPHPGRVDETVGGKVDPEAVKRTGRARRSSPRVVPLNPSPVGQPCLGIDPGYRNVGIVLRDGDAVLFAATLVRPEDINDAFEWARRVTEAARGIYLTHCSDGTRVACEGVTAPKGFKNGKREPLDPSAIIFTGVVAGALLREFRAEDILIVPPGGNGSQHVTHYPPCLVGRRPKDLPGRSESGDRGHEQSAFDVAGKAAREFFRPTPLSLRDSG